MTSPQMTSGSIIDELDFQNSAFRLGLDLRMAAMRSERDQNPRVSIWRKTLAAWQAITFPIRRFVSVLVLVLVYFLLVTPVGLIRKVLQVGRESGLGVGKKPHPVFGMSAALKMTQNATSNSFEFLK